MKIHLIRHAKTDPNSLSGKDFDRKLMTKGIIQANVLGYYLKDQNIQVPFTYCSSAIRTKETLAVISKILPLEKISYTDELYLADREAYLKLIWDLKHGKDVMLVGHNEGISDFASYLLEEDILMKTSHYLCIEFDSKLWKEVSRGTGKIIADFRPSVHFPD